MKKALRVLSLLLSMLVLLSTVPVFAATAPPYCGVDISRWQGTVDWKKVKDNGVDFAILRCFAKSKDTTFDTNYAGAAAQNIPVGAYVYMYATSAEAAAAEAQNAVAALDGRALTLPLFLDIEDSKVLALSKTTLLSLVLSELQIFENAGYKAGIYTSQSLAKNYNTPALSGYARWIAKWSCYTTDANPKKYTFADQDPNKNAPACDLWQFSNGGNGSRYGCASTYVDLNYCYTDYLQSLQPEDPPVHEHTFAETQVIAPTCTENGLLVQTCVTCGETVTTPDAPALGHTAPDENGCCTRCGTTVESVDLPQSSAVGVCPLCGERHTGLFGIFLLILHTILALFH